MNNESLENIVNKSVIFVIIIIIMLATKRFFDQRRQDVIDDNSPIISYQVEVIDKKDYPYPNMRSRQREVVTPETFRYEIYFQRLSASEVIKIFLKKEKEYNAIKKGDRSTLYMKGTRFVRFQSKANAK
ncbi:DUF2500 domain-containing protein [Arsenophonus endosymbiont of Aphis craccivora]|uniref:DUF2500 domain-containing protein n=1 Tax=Arsenophonus endosymbiont of Aphis craccivora TaxID=1231049 RepID=UPI0015DC8F35|nr:DUF2500 domain-containing protein [Arsenophonus endosymbiont of Aphis craccivora]QLK88238.1 DUF2500 domain-containing protein [Arsenophonus endosymbiont of Aphis craccivora]